MDNGRLIEWLSNLSLLGVVLFVLGTMLVAAFAGHATRRLMHLKIGAPDDSEHAQEDYIIDRMLGILALLMAFSFSMVLVRYEERRHLVVQEVNEIGTAYLRAQLLDEPYRGRLSRLLVDYTDNRIALGTGQHSGLDRQLAINGNLLNEIWATVIAARDSSNAHGVTTAILLTFNEVIDLDTERKVARQVRVPAPVLLLLYGFLILTAVVLGYVLDERRARIGAFGLFLLLSLYMSIIADLSRPTSGAILESQEPMLMLQQSLRSQAPQVFDKLNASLKADEPSDAR